MKWSFDAHLLTNTVVVKVSDSLEARNVRQLLMELLDSPIWNPTISIAYDCSELDVSFASIADIRDLNDIYQEIKERCKGNRTAIYADTMIKFGLARQLQIIAGLVKGPKLKVFDKWNELEDWVTLDPAYHPFENSDPNIFDPYRQQRGPM